MQEARLSGSSVLSRPKAATSSQSTRLTSTSLICLDLAWILIVCHRLTSGPFRVSSVDEALARYAEESMLDGLFFEEYPLVGGCLIFLIYVFVMYHLLKDARP